MLATTDKRREAVLEQLQAGFREWGVNVRISAIDPKTGTATVVAASYADFVLAKVELKLHGLTAIRAVS